MSKYLLENIVIHNNERFQKLHDAITIELYSVEFRRFDLVDPEALAFTVYKKLEFYNKTIVYFADRGETFEPNCLKLIQSTVEILLNEYNMDLANIRYMCGAYPCKENLKLYEAHCKTNNLIKLSCTIANNFEIRMSNEIKNNNIKIKNHPNKVKIFTCLNGQARVHRTYLFLYFLKNNLLEKSFLSLHANNRQIIDGIRNKISAIKTDDKDFYRNYEELCENFTNTDISLPIIQTIRPEDKDSQHKISKEDTELFNNSYFSVVTETSFFQIDSIYDEIFLNSHLDSIFLTEKTFRAIACYHPFIMVSRPHTLKHMRDAGYKTFSPFIDESYDDIEDDFLRLEKIAELIKDLCSKDNEFWVNFVDKTKEIVEHNYNVLLNAKPRWLIS